jgi:hypothetical protein
VKQTELNWQKGKVVLWDIDDLDLNKSIAAQIELLKEDLAQVEFENGVVLDLGWHPEFNPDGQFVLTLIKLKDRSNPSGEDWEIPVLQIKFRDMAQFMVNVNQAIEAANSHASV